MRIGRSVALASVALLALTACGGGDDDDSGDAGTPSAATQADDGANPAPTQGGSSAGGGGGGGGLGMGPETFARQLIVALRADDYTVDGNTITMQFEGGSTTSGDSQCKIAKATVGNNASVILSYPDGEVPCE